MEEEKKKKLLEFWKRIVDSDKKIRILVAVGLIGMGLLLLSELLPDKKPTEKENATAVSTQDKISNEQYAQQMEQRLKGVLEKIDGAGKCEVMVTLKQGTQLVYASEDKVTKDVIRDKNGDISVKTSDKDVSEGKLVLIESSDGTHQPIIETCIEPEINGVVVVCEGGKSQVVCQRITEAVKTVLGIGSNQICVSPYSG